MNERPNILGRVLLVVLLLAVGYAVYSFIRSNEAGKAKLDPAVQTYVDAAKSGNRPTGSPLTVAEDGRVLLRASFVAGKSFEKANREIGRGYQATQVRSDEPGLSADFYVPPNAVYALAARDDIASIKPVPAADALPLPSPTPVPTPAR